MTMFATTRQLTGTPHVHHGYVYTDSAVLAACKHKHRSSDAAQACADAMLVEQRRMARDVACPRRGGLMCVWRSGDKAGEYGPCVHCDRRPPKLGNAVEAIDLKRGRRTSKTLPWSVSPVAHSPSWRDAKEMAEAVIGLLGGEQRAASDLNARCFYTLACLAALDVNKNGDAPMLGAEKVRLT